MAEDIAALEKKLEQAANLQERIDLLNKLAWETGYSNTDRAYQLSEEARVLSTSSKFAKTPYLPGLANSLLNLARLNIESANYSDALSLLMQAQPIFENIGDKPGLMQMFNEFGRIYYYLSDYPSAIEFYLIEISLAQNLADREREAATLYNIGLIHLYSDNYKMALQDLEHAHQISEEIDDRRMQAYTLEGLAEVHNKLGDGNTALGYALKSLEISRSLTFLGLVNNSMLTIGDIYLNLGEVDQAAVYYGGALEVAESSGSRYDLAYSDIGMGKIARARGSLEQSLEWLNRAIILAEEMGSRDMVAECHLALAETYKRFDHFQKALEHYELFHEIEKEVFNAQSDTRLKSLEVLHQVETTRRETEIYRLKNALLQQEIEEHKKVQAMLEELVKTEPLTGLFNRRHFYDLAEKEFHREQRYLTPLSVIMADIDHFKEINDRFGHAVGDQALVTVATLIRRALRTVDLSCRYGGEEFAFLLPETAGPQALQVAERVRSEIASFTFMAGDQPFHVSISMGVAECPTGCPSLDKLFAYADEALYEAKNLGRNRSQLHPLAQTETPTQG